MKKFFTFIYFRIIVYFLSFISYNRKLLDINKLKIVFQNKDLLWEYIKKYYLNITILIFIIIGSIIGICYLNSRLKNGKAVDVEVDTIERIVPSDQIAYIGTYLLPLISSFYKLDFCWLLIYEAFIYSIFLKNINYHYMVLLGFWYRGYIIHDKNGRVYNLYTNINHEKLKELSLDKIYAVEPDFENEFICKNILYLSKK
ncbi:hypothetical protein [Cetobacterium somerae]